MFIKNIFSVLMILFSFSRAQAVIEARLTYGSLVSKPQLSDVYTGSTSDVPAAAANNGLGVDALILFPGVGFGFGARYENLGFKVDNAGLEYKTSSTRTALLLNYRLLNTFSFLARGALKSKKRFGGGVLEPTHQALFTYQKPFGSSELHLLKDAQIIHDFVAIRRSHERRDLKFRSRAHVREIRIYGTDSNCIWINFQRMKQMSCMGNTNEKNLFIVQCRIKL